MGNKKLIHAVAGSGKTRLIVDNVDPSKRNLIITYTETNQKILEQRLIRKFSRIPEDTHIFGVFEFLYSFCLVPYFNGRPKGINFNYKKENRFDNNSIDKDGRIIHNQLSHALLESKLRYNKKQIKLEHLYLDRIDQFFDFIFVDECQDFESYDFDWMLSLSKLNASVYLLGDFYQKTYSTSLSGNKGKGIHSDINKWFEAFEKNDFDVDITSLSNSHRCPPEICEFIKEKLGIDIESSKPKCDLEKIKLLENRDEIDSVMRNDAIMKLFYQKSSQYDCNSLNWGESKGGEFNNVCVVLNNTTWNHYEKDTLLNLVPSTKAKFYVACTRTLGNLYFIAENEVANYKLQ